MTWLLHPWVSMAWVLTWQPYQQSIKQWNRTAIHCLTHTSCIHYRETWSLVRGVTLTRLSCIHGRMEIWPLNTAPAVASLHLQFQLLTVSSCGNHGSIPCWRNTGSWHVRILHSGLIRASLEHATWYVSFLLLTSSLFLCYITIGMSSSQWWALWLVVSFLTLSWST